MPLDLNATLDRTRAAAQEDLADVGRQLIVAAGGLVTTVAVVLLNAWLADAFNFNFLSLSFWLVLPAVAFCGGMAAASGYFITARATQTMPTRH